MLGRTKLWKKRNFIIILVDLCQLHVHMRYQRSVSDWHPQQVNFTNRYYGLNNVTGLEPSR